MPLKQGGSEMYSHRPSEDVGVCFGLLGCLSASEVVRERKDSYAHKRASRRIGMSSLASDLTELTK